MAVRFDAATITKAAEKAGATDLFDVSRPGDGTTQYVLTVSRETLSSRKKADMSFLVGMIAGFAHDGTLNVGDAITSDLFREADKRNPDSFRDGFTLGYSRKFPSAD